MKKCLGCGGLVPRALASCPNCDVDRRSGKKLVAIAGLVALVATGCDSCGSATPMAVYGGPPPASKESKKKVLPPGMLEQLEEADGGSP